MKGKAIAVALSHLHIYTNGFVIESVILVNPSRRREADSTSSIARVMGTLRVGVHFPDGRAAVCEYGSGPLDVARNEDGLPTEPYVRLMGGAGGSSGWRFGTWVYPLPPDGAVEISLELPAITASAMNSSVDGASIRTAASLARIIWD